MADDLKRAITTIRDGLKSHIDRSERGKETAFTARSRDLGIADPDIQRDVSNAQLAKGAMGAAYIAADYALDPDKYSLEALKDKASRAAFSRVVQEGEKLINRQLPEGLNLDLNFRDMNFDEVRRGGRPTVGVGYKTPVGFGRARGTAGVEAKRYPSGEGYVGGNVRLKFAKGGHVKQYSNAPRKPRLK